MIDTLTLSAEAAMGLVERREVSPAELHALYLDAIAERDPELHCFLRLVEEPSGTGLRSLGTEAGAGQDWSMKDSAKDQLIACGKAVAGIATNRQITPMLVHPGVRQATTQASRHQHKRRCDPQARWQRSGPR